MRALCVLSMSGHTLEWEEPTRVDKIVADFLAPVDASRWDTWRSHSTALASAAAK